MELSHGAETQRTPCHGHALADEATKTLELLQRARQPKTEDPVALISSAGPAPKADTEDSSSDSDSSTDDDPATEEAVSLSAAEHERRDLMKEQVEANISGASAICHDPPLESLWKFPFAALTPHPEVLAIRDRPPTTNQELAPAAATFVASGLPPKLGMPPLEEVLSLDDMLPLEEAPPSVFPLKKCRHQDDD